MTINSGPDHDQTSVDHESRLITLELEYRETGTLTDESIKYLLNQAGWAIKLDKAGTEMAEAGIRFVQASDKAIEDLEHKLMVANLQVALLSTALKAEDSDD